METIAEPETTNVDTNAKPHDRRAETSPENGRQIQMSRARRSFSPASFKRNRQRERVGCQEPGFRIAESPREPTPKSP